MDDDDRTTAMGLFNTAEAYRLSAVTLEQAALRQKAGVVHAHRPVLFLYCHAIELYLKALLRTKHSVETIRNTFGHRINALVSEAKKLGLVVTDADREVFTIMVDADALIELRYIETGSKRSLDGLLGPTSKNVRDGVGDLLLKAGEPVRLGAA